MHRRGRALPIVLLLEALVPAAAVAETVFKVTPSLSISRVHDGDIFSSPGEGEADRITRLSPGIGVQWRAARWSLASSYRIDAEFFALHPELDGAPARQQAEIAWRHDAARPLTISLLGNFSETHNPMDLNVTTGLSGGRARARLWSVAPSLAGRPGPRTSVNWDLSLTGSEVIGGVETETLGSTLRLGREITARDRAEVSYGYTRFAFGALEPAESQALVIGWEHAHTPRTRFSLRAGPRLFEQAVDLEAGLSIEHDMRRGHLSLQYSRTQTSAVGRAEVLDAESLSATAAYRLTRSLHVSATPGVFRIRGAGGEARIGTAALRVTWQMRDWLSLRGEAQTSLQRDELEPALISTEDGWREIRRDIYMLSLGFDPSREPAPALEQATDGN